MMRFGSNEYMVHHYAYMAKVAEVRELESYAEAAKDTNWHAAMLGNRSLRMEVRENRKTEDPVPIRPTDWKGHMCK